MRNVNSNYASSQLCSCWFYLNYEECKSLNKTEKLNNEASFILTMRNVNIVLSLPPALLKIRFILTMRNVNSFHLIFHIQNLLSFILTMRNVNVLINFIGEMVIGSFILTMRNVNMYGKKGMGIINNVLS